MSDRIGIVYGEVLAELAQVRAERAADRELMQAALQTIDQIRAVLATLPDPLLAGVDIWTMNEGVEQIRALVR